MATDRTGVVLLQLGGPDSPESVQPFLYNLFRDPDIIDFPGAFLARKALARLISARRAGPVIERYKQIGGKSPILELTTRQATALEQELRASVDARVYVAMRYWHPFTSEAVSRLREDGCTRVILLPLYPQFSKATTVSSFKEWAREINNAGLAHIPTSSICCYYNHPLYVEALTVNIQTALKRFTVPAEEIDLVFSAHGVPVSVIKKGDPYQLQIQETVRLTLERGGWTSPHVLCYQSKVGPAEWLRPSLVETLHALPARGRTRLLVIPVAFVTDHIETLHEIDIEAREDAMNAGVKQFELMPALNDHQLFIKCLADLVLKTVRGEPLGLATCNSVRHSHLLQAEPRLCPLRTSINH